MNAVSKLSLENVQAVSIGVHHGFPRARNFAKEFRFNSRFAEASGDAHPMPPRLVCDEMVAGVIRMIQSAEFLEIGDGYFSTRDHCKIYTAYPAMAFYVAAEGVAQ